MRNTPPLYVSTSQKQRMRFISFHTIQPSFSKPNIFIEIHMNIINVLCDKLHIDIDSQFLLYILQTRSQLKPHIKYKKRGSLSSKLMTLRAHNSKNLSSVAFVTVLYSLQAGTSKLSVFFSYYDFLLIEYFFLKSCTVTKTRLIILVKTIFKFKMFQNYF